MKSSNLPLPGEPLIEMLAKALRSACVSAEVGSWPVMPNDVSASAAMPGNFGKPGN
jgi:hypothetical protein